MTTELENKILDKLDHALAAARQSTPESLSPILQEIRNKIDTQAKTMSEHVELHAINDKKWDEALVRMEPFLKRSEEDREFREGLEQRAKKFGFWAGIWLTLTLVVGSIYYGFKHLK